MSEQHEKLQGEFFKALTNRMEEISVSLQNINVSLVEISDGLCDIQFCIEKGKKEPQKKKEK